MFTRAARFARAMRFFFCARAADDGGLGFFACFEGTHGAAAGVFGYDVLVSKKILYIMFRKGLFFFKCTHF